MSYLHCHSCQWSQDDFWDEKWYNPISFLEKNYKEELLNWDLSRIITMDKFDDKRRRHIGSETITEDEFIARQFENWASKIRRMYYRTEEEFKKENPEWKCPICWKKDLDID